MKEEWQSIFQMYMDERNRQYTTDSIAEGISRVTLNRNLNEMQRWERIDNCLKDRKIVIHHAHSQVDILGEREEDGNLYIPYHIVMTWHLKQNNEEIVQKTAEQRECVMRFENGWWIIGDEVLAHENKPEREGHKLNTAVIAEDLDEEAEKLREHDLQRVTYDRQKAVAYAERWWNDYNPKFQKFEDDCTNYVSQCMWAGNAPMVRSADRAKGWWYRFESPVNWSFSWTVANALRWFLPSRATEVGSPEELGPGDIICYDFTGDGRWQHTTIVVGKDAYGRPLVNAHTTNSQHRFWDYQDSYAWTDNTKYKFFKINDHF